MVIIIKTLKGKITLIYLSLILIIIFVGIFSEINAFGLSKSVDGLMTDNYKSIQAADNMLNSLEEQDKSLVAYNLSRDEANIINFDKNSSDFYSWYYIAANNITEPGEKQLIDKIKTNYLLYLQRFSDMRTQLNQLNSKQLLDYYQNNILPVFNSEKDNIRSLSKLNEDVMFKGKNALKQRTVDFMYIMLFIFSFGVVLGIIISIYFTNKSLKPIYNLTETIKSIKEGQLYKEIPVLVEDEIGMLSSEFNNMTKRLQEYENSTKGKLLTEKNRSLAIIKSITDPLIVLNNEFRFLLINKSCESFFDIYEQNTFGRHFLEVIRNSELYDHISASMLNNMEISEKIIAINKFGKKNFFNIIVTTIKSQESNKDGVVVLMQNITHLKEMENMKSDFVSAVSHEFKTPLTSIMIGTSLLAGEEIGKLTKKQKEIFNAIQEDGQNLTDLVTDLLQVSTIDSGEAIYKMESLDINVIVEKCSKYFVEQAEQKGVILYTELEEKMPKAKVDEEKITWVLNNLLSNAIKFTKKDDKITVKTYFKGDIYVSVADTGIGIPENYKEKIFERFVQVKESTLEVKGTGLGLSIARDIINAHNGEIICNSKLGEGSIFTFNLKVNKENFMEEGL